MGSQLCSPHPPPGTTVPRSATRRAGGTHRSAPLLPGHLAHPLPKRRLLGVLLAPRPGWREGAGSPPRRRGRSPPRVSPGVGGPPVTVTAGFLGGLGGLLGIPLAPQPCVQRLELLRDLLHLPLGVGWVGQKGPVTPPAPHQLHRGGAPPLLTDLGADVLDVLGRAEGGLAQDGLRRGAGGRPQVGVAADAGGVHGQHVGARLRLVHPRDVVPGTLLAQELGGGREGRAVSGPPMGIWGSAPLGLTRTSASLARPVRSQREPLT